MWARRNQGLRIPNWPFFVAKYFGSGVIVATAFIHVSRIYCSVAQADNLQLLAPAHDALTNPCLTGPITDYDWVEGIALMTVFVLFFVELLAMRYAVFDPHGHSHGDSEAASGVPSDSEARAKSSEQRRQSVKDETAESPHARGVDHLGHGRQHIDTDAEIQTLRSTPIEDFNAQMTAIFILEFGIIFHSIFVGLTLAVSGEEFQTLYVVIVFHQTFEGLGLGTRLAGAPWPKNKRWTPYLLGFAYSLSTPVAIAVGLGVREAYQPGSQTSLIVNGVFDSISAGILLYTGLVELMAHEFMFSETMRRAPPSKMLSAFGMMCLGAGEFTPVRLQEYNADEHRTNGSARQMGLSSTMFRVIDWHAFDFACVLRFLTACYQVDLDILPEIAVAPIASIPFPRGPLHHLTVREVGYHAGTHGNV